jgi:hypothetical protein
MVVVVNGLEERLEDYALSTGWVEGFYEDWDGPDADRAESRRTHHVLNARSSRADDGGAVCEYQDAA